MMHDLIVSWFNFVHDWGYTGVFFLMALESSIVPIPSEVVLPPAAFWASQGKMNFWGVVAAGTAGSYFGSVVSFYIARWVGGPVVAKYGKYFLLPPAKVNMAEAWVLRHGNAGIFVARLLPVIRHLISIPAGILKMNFLRFSIATIVGAFSWCLILSWFGQQVIGDSPELLNSPTEMVTVLKHKLIWFVSGVIILGVAYGMTKWAYRRGQA